MAFGEIIVVLGSLAAVLIVGCGIGSIWFTSLSLFNPKIWLVFICPVLLIAIAYIFFMVVAPNLFINLKRYLKQKRSFSDYIRDFFNLLKKIIRFIFWDLSNFLNGLVGIVVLAILFLGLISLKPSNNTQEKIPVKVSTPIECRNGTWNKNHPKCRDKYKITSPMDME